MSSILDSLALRSSPIHLWQGRDHICTWSAETLRESAARWAHTLRNSGAIPGAVVATCAPTSLELVAFILGTWQCGAAVVVLPELDHGSESSLRRVVDGLQQLLPVVLLLDGKAPADLISQVPSALSLDAAETSTHPADMPPPYAATPKTVCLMQLTSGSTGRAKVVPITHKMLMENCLAMSARIEVRCDDHMLSWLPLTHDMGFSGALCQALASDIELTLLPTALFAQTPMSLLQALSDQQATLSPNPPAVYALLTRLGRRAQRDGLDLSHWRFAWVGAEPVFAQVLQGFEAAMRPLGLRDNVLQPSYGMAEAVVGLSFAPEGRRWRVLHVQARALRESGLVVPLHTSTSSTPAKAGCEALSLVSNGVPLDGVEIRVCDEQGDILAPGRQGRLWVRAPWVSGGYLHGEDRDSFSEGWFDTGDLGFLWEGEVYVSGRVKNIISRGGVKIGAHEIESVVEAELDLRSGRVVAFACLDHSQGRERVVVVVARRFGTRESALQDLLTKALLRQCGLRVDEFVFCGPGSLPKTTSGKLQRNLVRERWLQGDSLTLPKPGKVV